ncbi:tRNA sulfurtransferase ThiI [Schinkia azotoformans MEV2011]|uniref:Probable tRNA sulfurtransferase n=1 Tax=Schinkia azotoformans MEV2011 TaxID=1348973 RepID=A0A072NPP0_SCHAZ|nr:tRNA uracil 4-sulfurtransferase ThiI [Schinkia azotoformans]KEF39604.1 tRNA sulfurtransferase ThiI [Schinkia azotoformans MEV2011]MEC1694294.1 tRNA 4-thiouridine(8) synthase ThiI [Schinkia azotoformans]MEC1714905.1 tRNA 4-thiouridine(8) synthase ThiI [Schinkia azotoformans]MEC1723492.1 tRNA 4-thiouridine(8) synthase ThiI [Schinkia azotoformans]MEC1742842.1 tRNA 4-thiouridine(8) synthase ThiI [Schinkia azotoformans]
MEYDHILIRYGEMSLKGKNRSKFSQILKNNIKVLLKLNGCTKAIVNRTKDRMFIDLNGDDHEKISEILKDVFGIQSFSLAMKVTSELEEIQKGALSALQEANPHAKTFKVTAKRPDKSFPIRSQELNHLIGGYILKNTEGLTVDVHNPDVNVRVEVRTSMTFITCKTVKGAGGFPVGSNGKVMLMLSGGIDSPVAGYMTMKRGVKIEAVHFHSPPFTNERAKQKVLDLAGKLTKYGGRIRVHIVPFTEIQQEIHKAIPSSYTMTAMRRMMLRIAEQIAVKNNALAIATGESLGQVASQTIESMNTINEVTNYPIIRPLIAMDKLEIIDIAHAIDTYDISIRPYEDCCTIFLPSDPKTKPKKDRINYYETKLGNIDELIEAAVTSVETIDIERNTRKHEIEKQFEDLF